MSQTTKPESKHSLALEALRRRICLADPNEETVLHESALTEEFGMSRTPIRQVLQRLAYERLVETRSGVGTVVVALDPEAKPRDKKVHEGLLRAVLLFDLPTMSVTQHSDVFAISGLASLVQPDDKELLFDIKKRLHDVISAQIPDEILRDAYAASFWRMVRWQMAEFAEDPISTTSQLQKSVQHLNGYEPRNSNDLVRRAMERAFDA